MKAQLGFAGVAVLLLVAAAAEIAAPVARPTVAVPVRSVPSPPAAAAVRPSAPALIAAIDARPLFRPDRRPVAAVATHSTGLPRLSGILIADHHRVAMFTDAADKTVMRQRGDRVGHYLVALITDNAVTLQAPGVRLVLKPRFAGLAGARPMPMPPPGTAGVLHHPAMPLFQTPGKE